MITGKDSDTLLFLDRRSKSHLRTDFDSSLVWI